ncbi:MAG: hypothetical protein HKN09_04145 [Saprospiraceae bacterium]|nr:hypothetical protein [Saprospiraceae bacterium]
MAKYRLLTDEELKSFEKEFIQYLVVNGIDADAWEKLKEEDKDKANEIIDLFSDVIFENLMRKTKYILRLQGQFIFSFCYDEDKASLLIAEYGGKEEIGFKDLEELKQFVDQNKDLFTVSMQSKSYEGNREEEVFKLLDGGCIVDRIGIYDKLNALLISQSN